VHTVSDTVRKKQSIFAKKHHQNKMELKKIGNIVNSKGIDGNLILVGCSKGLFLSKDCEVFIGYTESFAEKYILAEDFIGNINRSELSLKNIDSKEKTQELKEKALFATKEDILKNNEGYIFPDEIIGCRVLLLEDDSCIGEIIDIWDLPANDVWLVETEKGNLPLPVIDDVIKEIDLQNKVIKIILLDGLIDLIG